MSFSADLGADCVSTVVRDLNFVRFVFAVVFFVCSTMSAPVDDVNGGAADVGT